MTHFVYEGTEVRKTGRIATKEVMVFGNKSPKKELILYEITPVSDDFDWKKWVPHEQLFVISDTDK